MEEFRVLPGLPATGPWPEQFSASGHGTHREGIVAQFFPEGKPSWIGNFQPGWTEYSAVLPHANGRSVIVIAGGQGYVIAPGERRLVAVFGGTLEVALAIPSLGVMVVGDGVRLEAVDASGLRWRSRRISWDGMRAVRVEGDEIKGEAWSVLDDCYYPFAVDVTTGTVDGGSYTGPPE